MELIALDRATRESPGVGGGEEESSASRVSAVVSPPGEEVRASTAANESTFLQEQGSLGINICPFTLLHPQDGVLWNVGPRSLTVFERSSLIRFIHNVGRRDLLSDFHHLTSGIINVTNPVNRGTTLRINAMSLIEELPATRLNTLSLLRQMSGEPTNDPDLIITDEQMQDMRQNLEWVVRRAESTITARRSNGEVAIDVDRHDVHDNIGQERRTVGDGFGAANEDEGRRVRMRLTDHHVRPAEEQPAESDSSFSSLDSILRIPVVQRRTSTAGRTDTAGRTMSRTAGRTAGRTTGHGGSRGGVGHGAAGHSATNHGGADALLVAAASRAAVSMRRPLGSFVNATNIRDASRAEAIVNIIILAENHDGGLAGSLAQGHRTGWFKDNVSTLFASDGPLSQFIHTQPLQLMRHFGNAEKLARLILNRNHSNEQSGADQEVVPVWVQKFGRLFESQLNNPSASAQAELTRDERRMVATSIMGRQAPLGQHDTTLPVQIRTETASNIGNTQRMQVVGQFEAQVLDQEGMTNHIQQQQDTSRVHPAPRFARGGQQNGTRRRNIHNPSAEFSIPHARYGSMEQGLLSISRLTDSIEHAFNNPPPVPVRTIVDVENDYRRATDSLNAARDSGDFEATDFWISSRQRLLSERTCLDAANTAELVPRAMSSNEESGNINE